MAIYTPFLPRRFRRGEVTVPVVRLHGVIMASASPLRPVLNIASIAPLLEKAFADRRAPAVALSVNSPGGSAVQSRLIFRRIRDLANENDKKIFVFVEDVAASGGYMIAIAGDEIFADPSSVVGSIGVVHAGFGFVDLLGKIGIDRRVYTAGENKVALDPFQPEKQTDIDRLKSLQSDVHQVFIDLVKERRAGKLANSEDLFSGLFWSGVRGRELGLVDGLGDIRATLRERYGDKMRLRVISMPRGPFARRAGGIAGVAARGLAEAAEERALWARYGL